MKHPLMLYAKAFLAIFVFLSAFAPRIRAKSTLIDKVIYRGFNYTDLTWTQEYLDLNCPCLVSEIKLLEIVEKLLTTQVFMKASAFIEVTQDRKTHLVIKVSEKWTTIPVLRGAFGGGTPLLVAGVYDTHSFGRLWTLGGELRKYGDAPPGGVIWARAPRWLGGRYYLNLELWKQNQIRTIYDRNFLELGNVDSKSQTLRSEVQAPLSDKVKLGLQLSTKIQNPISFSQKSLRLKLNDSNITFNENTSRSNYLFLRFIYDDISVNNLSYNGSRLLASIGPTIYQERIDRFWELEYFYYKLIASDWNLAFHYLIGSATDTSFQSLYFLGGFDSIRGIPDGAMFGRNASFGNFEIRNIALRLPKLWLQVVGFADTGLASDRSINSVEPWKSSIGVGIRLAIPQVNRLVFRIDYAWAADGSGKQGITAGMNQFFQPYKPL